MHFFACKNKLFLIDINQFSPRNDGGKIIISEVMETFFYVTFMTRKKALLCNKLLC